MYCFEVVAVVFLLPCSSTSHHYNNMIPRFLSVLSVLLLLYCCCSSFASGEPQLRHDGINLEDAFRGRVFPEGNQEMLKLPKQWRDGGRCPPDARVALTLALRQNNAEKLEMLFWAVSDPSSPLYGQYLSDDQLHRLIAPSSETLANVTQWLIQHGTQ